MGVALACIDDASKVLIIINRLRRIRMNTDAPSRKRALASVRNHVIARHWLLWEHIVLGMHHNRVLFLDRLIDSSKVPHGSSPLRYRASHTSHRLLPISP